MAAPIGLVGQAGYSQSAPIVDIPDRPALVISALPPQRALYRIGFGFTLRLTDASGSRVVQSQAITAVLQRQTRNLSDPVMAAHLIAGARLATTLD